LHAGLPLGETLPTLPRTMGYALGTMRLLKENWAWFLAPIVLFTAAAAYLYFAGDGSPAGDGIYVTH
jgi:hypothetical protein